VVRSRKNNSEADRDVADDTEDLLTPEEIEALLNAASAGSPIDGAPSDSSVSGENPPKSASPQATPASPPASTEALLEQAEADLAAAVAPQMDKAFGDSNDLGEPAAFQFEDFSAAEQKQPGELGSLDAIQDVELDMRIELGRAELLIEEVLKLVEGSVVPLNKLAGDPVDILVNGRLIARGEVLVLNDNFCVRVAEILTPEY
jgi:flagellar motor switch protein FliN/FliY